MRSGKVALVLWSSACVGAVGGAGGCDPGPGGGGGGVVVVYLDAGEPPGNAACSPPEQIPFDSAPFLPDVSPDGGPEPACDCSAASPCPLPRCDEDPEWCVDRSDANFGCATFFGIFRYMPITISQGYKVTTLCGFLSSSRGFDARYYGLGPNGTLRLVGYKLSRDGVPRCGGVLPPDGCVPDPECCFTCDDYVDGVSLACDLRPTAAVSE